jgi:DNA polymerase III delta prime subunit
MLRIWLHSVDTNHLKKIHKLNLVMKLAWLVCGGPGSGKSTWILNKAKKDNAKLIRHIVRTDRSLRQGRPLLFSQHRSSEKTIIWLEGADTLTTDAQAFLRRILETAGPNVEFALEIRDETTMNPPLLSRCQRIAMKDHSYRQENAAALIEKRGFADVRKMIQLAEQRENIWNPWSNPREALIQARAQALNPERLLNKILKNESFDIQRDYYRRLGDGISPWLLLSWAVMRLTNAKMKQNAA